MATWISALRRGVRAHRLALLFLAYGTATVAMLAILVPPFQNPDELAHFLRADHLSRGTVIGRRLGEGSGGLVDRAIYDVSNCYARLRDGAKVSAEQATCAYRVVWDGSTLFGSHGSTAPNPPFGYLLAATAIRFGKVTDLGVVHTLMLARLANGLAALALAAVGLAIARHGRWLFFTVLTFPMTLSMFASASQDALTLGSAALALGMISRACAEGRTQTPREFLATVVAMMVMVTARPPYFPLTTLLCVPRASSRLRPWLGIAFIGCVTLLWTSFAAARVMVPLQHDAVHPDAAAQLASLVEHPARIFELISATLRKSGMRNVEETVGVLGYLDVFLPRPYLVVAGLAVGLSVVVGSKYRPSSRLITFTVVSVVVSAGAIWLSQYLMWTAVGAREIDGVQGRYFLPLAMAMCFLVPQSRAASVLGRYAPIWVAAMPLCGFAAILVAIMRRYYAG